MKHASLFSGIGGFDLAAQWMGWKNVFHCEINPFGRKLLEYYWPNAISYDDITKTDFTVHRGEIDILTGGFPCQPFSLAGKRKGTADDRNLWPQMLRTIKEIQPTWVVGENVPGIINWSKGLVFEQVQADLEAEGYEVWPVILPACSVNAPHRRERVWFVAYANSNDRNGSNLKKFTAEAREQALSWIRERVCNGTTPDTTSQRREVRQSDNRWSHTEKDTIWMDNRPERFSSERITPDTNKQRQQERYNAGQPGNQRWFNWFVPPHENWQNFPTESPVCSGDDGLSSRLDGITFPKFRNESIKAYGNAIVPQVAIQIFKTIFYINNHYNINLHEKQQKKKKYKFSENAENHSNTLQQN